MLYTSAHAEVDGQEVNIATQTTVPDTSADFHTYGVDWEPDYLTWYFDGKEVYRHKTLPGMNTPMYIETNLAPGGDWGGDVDSTTPFPSKMEIKWIRVYQSKPWWPCHDRVTLGCAREDRNNRAAFLVPPAMYRFALTSEA